MQRLVGREIDAALGRRAVVLLVADEGTGDELRAPGEYGERVSKRVCESIASALAEAPHIEVRLAHRLKSGTALARWGLGAAPLSAALVVDGLVAWHAAVPLNETGSTSVLRTMAEAVAAWPPEPMSERAAEAAVVAAEGYLADDAHAEAVEVLFGPAVRTRLPELLDEEWRDRALAVATAALAGVRDYEAAGPLLLAWDRRAPRPREELDRWLGVVAKAIDRGAAEALLERWAERFPDAPGVALGQARLLLSVGDAEGALAAVRRAVEAAGQTRETHRLAISALKRSGQPDLALVELSGLRHQGGWTEADEVEYAALRDRAMPAALRAGRGRARDVVDEIGDGARRLGRGLMAMMRKNEGRVPYRPRRLADAPRLLRDDQVAATLAELEAAPLVAGMSHAAAYWSWRGGGSVLDAALAGEPTDGHESAEPQRPELDPLQTPGRRATGTKRAADHVIEALVTYATWFRDEALAGALARARVHGARTTRWALQARSAGLDPRLVSVYECAAREEALRAEALDDWLKTHLAGDDDDRAHAGWQAAAESAWVEAPGLDAKYAELRLAIMGR